LIDQFDFIGIASVRSVQIKKSIISIFKTVYVCIVLTFGAMMFSKDANDLVLRPIERMIDKVNKIAKNPIRAQEQALLAGSD
jgi:hypothetical protein